jgi:hypothetical protein
MMIEMLRIEGRVIEIPVSYYRRRGGESKHSSSRWQSMRTGLRMLRDPAEAPQPELSTCVGVPWFDSIDSMAAL